MYLSCYKPMPDCDRLVIGVKQGHGKMRSMRTEATCRGGRDDGEAERDAADTGVGYGTKGYNDLYFGVRDDVVNDWNSGLTLAVNISQNVVLSTGIRYVDLLDKDIEDGAESIYGKGDSTVTKIALTITL